MSIADLERALSAAVPARYPTAGSGTASCEATGPLTPWSPVLCHFLPDEPAEFGGIHVSVFDHCRYGWGVGECCNGQPWVADYPSGLTCGDLLAPPPGSEPGRWHPSNDHLSYGLAVHYWLTDGRPGHMDTDGDGRPCEAVYPSAEVVDYWQSVRRLSHPD